MFFFIVRCCLLLGTSGARFTNDFVVELDHDDEDKAADFGNRHGLIYISRVFEHHFHFIHPKVHRRSAKPYDRLSLEESSEVVWFEQQFVKNRSKRDYTINDDLTVKNMADPLYDEMWYLLPDYEDRNKVETRHMNISAAWTMGYTGKGVVVSILDDGIEMTHPDLAENYDPKASTDVNGNDDDPTPKYNRANEKLNLNDPQSFSTGSADPKITDNLKGYIKEINRHGTRCAGEVAATANNNVCVPGVAYHAKVGGVRMLDGDVTDLVEARSIGHNQGYVDIYSASWGPDDDGRTVDGPAKLAIKAFLDGAMKGRNGKGNIFVWASGNGGRYDDNCNCDGYTNSIYTISISSTSERENIPWYSEPCASTLASTYSSGASDEKQIITTDLRGMCTKKHTGTSASAPLAAGIIALALEANPSLTWRDVQHLLVRTSEKHHLNTKDWNLNAMGRWFSNRYGYGLMDAGRMVETAITWRNVPEYHMCTVIAFNNNPEKNPGSYSIDGNTLTVEFTVDPTSCDQVVNMLEHLTVILSANPNGKRGDLEIRVISPMGTTSTILSKRSHDLSGQGFNNYEFLSVEFWDENPKGIWKIEFSNLGTSKPKFPLQKSPVDVSGIVVRLRGSVGFDQSNGIKQAAEVEKPTVKPTTKKPTTMEPTTKKATTKKPTTMKPTTMKPTTMKPTTKVPTTLKPTTKVPTTLKPTTTIKKETTKIETTTQPKTKKEPKPISDSIPTTVPISETIPTTSESTPEESKASTHGSQIEMGEDNRGTWVVQPDNADNHNDIESLLLMLLIGIPSVYILFQLLLKYKKKPTVAYSKLSTIQK